MLARNILFLFFIFFFHDRIFCQQAQRHFDPDSLRVNYFKELKKEFGNNKQYPVQFEKQILIALSYYPELKNTPIVFRTRVRHSIAITRSTWTGVFQRAERRHYVVTISDGTEPALRPILFKNLPFNAQVGVIGHELGHIVQYSGKSTLDLIRYGVSNVSAKYIDRFEYNADSICIAHGLGYQLLEWSSFVRKTMDTENWVGPDYIYRPKKRERYMNPSTILRRISSDPRYQSVQ